MNKEIKKLWIEALRSGKYKQGKGKLKRDGKYCCLGVLCAISPWKNCFMRMKPPLFSASKNEMRLLPDKNEILPNKVKEWAEIKHNNPVFFNEDLNLNSTLSRENDIKKRSFLEIADLIEKYL